MKTLKDYCKQHGIKYRAAWNRFKQGKIPGAYQDEFGKILIPDDVSREPYVVCYARVSSSQNKDSLERQAERLVHYANACGHVVKQVVKEVGSGLNDNRKKLNAVLNNPVVTHIIVEHKDRLTRFGFNYLEMLLKLRDCKIVVINEACTDRDDLMQDFVSLVTSFTARLYGLRRSRRKAEKIIKAYARDTESPSIP
jgi:predicted site-specific integrase-resolvase